VSTVLAVTCSILAGTALVSALSPQIAWFDWRVVVNNAMTMPGETRTFNSYNDPSVNVDGLVVFRARSRGGSSGEPAHGVFSRDMGIEGSINTIFDRHTAVPPPNALGTTFVEPPSFPRIDMWSNTVASRGNHPPVWEYLLDGAETRAGTTGIYTNPFGTLITGASNLGAAPGFEFLAVPSTSPAIKFDVFPGAPAVTDTATLVFKGNYSEPDPEDPSTTISKTGVYYRDLMDDTVGGIQTIISIADSETAIPGAGGVRFGSVAPPSAAGRLAVFTGWDDEWNPTAGGIYLAPLAGPSPRLQTLVGIGDRVPGEPAGTVFTNLSESLSFDGRFVAFWGTWGSATRTLLLQCPLQGNRDRLEYCRATYPLGFTTIVPVHQGVFVHDTRTGQTRVVAKAPDDFTDFVYWNFSGTVPGMSGHADDVGEPARWRSATFVAVSGLVDGRHTDAGYHAVFKARTGRVADGAYVDAVDGLYVSIGPGHAEIATLVRTGTDGTLVDPAAVDSLTGEHLPITNVAVERDGFRGRWLAINVGMGTEEAGWAGLYVTQMPERLR
jgi:hypothetical protein